MCHIQTKHQSLSSSNRKESILFRVAGFTLIEAVVVLVIMAILAISAVPIYTGYLKSSRTKSASDLARTVGATANIHFRKTGQVPDDVSVLNISYDTSLHKIYLNNDTSVTVKCAEDMACSLKVSFK